MEQIHVCPSTLAEGYSTYSPAALRSLFNGKVVSHILPFDSPNNEEADNSDYARHVGRISLSGVQPKASLCRSDTQIHHGSFCRVAEVLQVSHIQLPHS